MFNKTGFEDYIRIERTINTNKSITPTSITTHIHKRSKVYLSVCAIKMAAEYFSPFKAAEEVIAIEHLLDSYHQISCSCWKACGNETFRPFQ